MDGAAEVRKATSGEVRPLAQALAAAFAEDPVWAWLLPSEGSRIARLERFFALELNHVVLPGGEVWTSADVAGAALTLPPDGWRMPLTAQVRHGFQYTRIFGHRLPWAFGLITKMEARHLREPHVYYPYIGVAPAAQGRGLGTKLMGPALDRCDRDRLPAYLEASSPGSARLYRRLGFADIEELRFAGSPPLALMRRAPA